MAERDRASADTTQNRTMRSAAVTPSEDTERPDGLAFDVEKGADLAGVRVGDQTASNPDAAHTEQAVRETGGGVGLAVPGAPGRKAVEPPAMRPANADLQPWHARRLRPAGRGPGWHCRSQRGVAVTVNVGLAWRSLTGNVIRPRVRGIGRRS